MLKSVSPLMTVFILIVIFVSGDRYTRPDVSAQGIDNNNMNITSCSSPSIYQTPLLWINSN
ncbi:MAG: hypothetical protein R2685_13780 [Candidatus Nitrosocosmicus sp.]|nr:hypothetical protein [Candidatus Nitrosocosmicus sp.]